MTTTTTTTNNATMKTLDLNFFVENISDDMKKEFHLAIFHEKCDMELSLVAANIVKLNAKIENKNDDYTKEEIEAFRSELAKLEKVQTELNADLSANKEVHEKVLADMTRKDPVSHNGNSKDVVRTVLRVLASVENSKLVKSAVVPAFTTPELYNALETIHINSKATEDGAISLTKEVKAAYKEASKQLETIIKTTFSLPFETSYTSKTRVKLTADDKKLLNDCYIKGFNNKFSIDRKTGVVSFDERKINTLVTVKENKKTGKLTYNYTGLASTIANIVLKHYFA